MYAVDPPVAARRAPLVALLAANVISVLGGIMSLLAVPWFVYESTGSPFLTGVAAVCETLPLVLCSLFTGPLVQRFGARRIRVWSDVLSGASVVAIPVLHATTGIAFWQLLALVALNGALRAPAPAASLVLLATASQARGTSTTSTSGVYMASIQVAATVGAPLGGLLIAVLNAPLVLLVDAATFLVSAVLVQAMLPADPPTRGTGPTAKATSTSTSLDAGFAALRRDRALILLTPAVVVLAVLEGSWHGVLAPVYGQDVVRSPLLLGALFGAFGAGATAGSLLYPTLSGLIPAQHLLWAAVLGAGACRYAALAAALQPVMLLIAVLVSGLAAGVLGPLWLGVQYARVPREQQSHVFGVTFALQQGGVAIGALAGGLLLQAMPVRSALAILAVAALAVAATLAVTRPLQHPDVLASRRPVGDPDKPDGAGP